MHERNAGSMGSSLRKSENVCLDLRRYLLQTFSNCDCYVKQKLWYRFDSFEGRLEEKKADQRLTTKMVEQDVKADLKYI
jgi:hypothetical protein